MTAGQVCWVVTEDVTNLPNRNQIGHAVEVIGNKLTIVSRFNSFPSFVNFSSQFFLDITILCQLPEKKSQLELARRSLKVQGLGRTTTQN